MQQSAVYLYLSRTTLSGRLPPCLPHCKSLAATPAVKIMTPPPIDVEQRAREQR